MSRKDAIVYLCVLFVCVYLLLQFNLFYEVCMYVVFHEIFLGRGPVK
jgi:hypothetical protein